MFNQVEAQCEHCFKYRPIRPLSADVEIPEAKRYDMVKNIRNYFCTSMSVYRRYQPIYQSDEYQ